MVYGRLLEVVLVVFRVRDSADDAVIRLDGWGLLV